MNDHPMTDHLHIVGSEIVQPKRGWFTREKRGTIVAVQQPEPVALVEWDDGTREMFPASSLDISA